MNNQTIPLFPLKSIVLPGGIFPLRIFERRYIDMVKNCIKNDTGFCIVLVRNNSQKEYIDDVYNYGCYVEISDWNQLEDGLLGITVEGKYKIHILDSKLNDNNLLCGKIEKSPEEKEFMIPQKYLILSKFYRKIYPGIKNFISFKNERYSDATWISYRLTECLPLDSSTKNKLISINHGIDRLERIYEIVIKVFKDEIKDL
tara:strand:- start:2167 stop:2769 length:603 start_codon:yes stop_codon:yes gene_type:complete